MNTISLQINECMLLKIAFRDNHYSEVLHYEIFTRETCIDDYNSKPNLILLRNELRKINKFVNKIDRKLKR